MNNSERIVHIAKNRQRLEGQAALLRNLDSGLCQAVSTEYGGVLAGMPEVYDAHHSINKALKKVEMDLDSVNRSWSELLESL